MCRCVLCVLLQIAEGSSPPHTPNRDGREGGALSPSHTATAGNGLEAERNEVIYLV